MIAWIGAAGAAASLLLLAVSVAVLEARRRRATPAPERRFLPRISVVKPLCGLDAGLEENLESFFRQDYPDFEVVFSFADGADPAFEAARRVADRHPAVRAVFAVEPREPGRNAKVNRLEAGLRRARGSVFVLSDGDVRVAPDFLRRAIAPLADPGVGLVSHLFRATNAGSVPARLEALYLDGVLRPATATLADLLRTPCVVGKSIVLSRAALHAIGGLAPLRNHLAEDFLLGRLVARAGYRVVLAREEIATVSGARRAASVWARHRRWAILRKRLGGAGYAAEALASPALFAGAAILFADRGSAAPAVAAALWALRLAVETVALRRAPEPAGWTAPLLLPLRDLAVSALFFAGLFGRRTSWRGRTLRVGRETLLLDDAASGAPALGPLRPRPAA